MRSKCRRKFTNYWEPTTTLAMLAITALLLGQPVISAFAHTENALAYRAILCAAREEIPELPGLVEHVISDFSTSIRKALREILPGARRVLCAFHLDMSVPGSILRL